jgi:hypothetical protein
MKSPDRIKTESSYNPSYLSNKYLFQWDLEDIDKPYSLKQPSKARLTKYLVRGRIFLDENDLNV